MYFSTFFESISHHVLYYNFFLHQYRYIPVLPVLKFFNTEIPVLENDPGIGCTNRNVLQIETVKPKYRIGSVNFSESSGVFGLRIVSVAQTQNTFFIFHEKNLNKVLTQQLTNNNFFHKLMSALKTLKKETIG
jgi:hypothetical protein